jgi:hypothetical protein
MAFPTEFAFTLPRGYRDGDGRVHSEGTMRLATARDEITPLQDFRVKNNRAYLVVLLLSRVITRLGSLNEGEVTPSVIEGLYSSDLTFLQEFYRHVNESGTSHAQARCPNCATQFLVDLGAGTPVAAAS